MFRQLRVSQAAVNVQAAAKLCAFTTQPPFRLKHRSVRLLSINSSLVDLFMSKLEIKLGRFGVDLSAGRFEVVVQTMTEVRGH